MQSKEEELDLENLKHSIKIEIDELIKDSANTEYEDDNQNDFNNNYINFYKHDLKLIVENFEKCCNRLEELKQKSFIRRKSLLLSHNNPNIIFEINYIHIK